MQRAITHLSTAFVIAFILEAASLAGDWAQFRGENAAGVVGTSGEVRYPVRLSSPSSLLWKVALPPGISSPCVLGDRIYLTALKDSALVTLALERETGKLVWEKPAPAERIEEVHQIGSPATPTPCSDGRRVYVFFGSCGLLCYDLKGELAWSLPLGPFKNNYGQASSPVLWRDRVILNCDQDIDSFLLAADKETGRVIWRTPRPGFPRGFSTPVISSTGGKDEVLVAGTLRLISYDPNDGKELWSIRGLARIVNSTPVLGGGLLYVSSYAPGADADDRIQPISFAKFAVEHDADKDGFLVENELPEGPFRTRYRQLDADKDGKITPEEWDSMQQIFEAARNSIFAVKPEGSGELPQSRVLWRHERAIPYVPSPLYVDGLVYILKDLAILTCLDAKTGQVLKQKRLPAGGNYYASPVAAGSTIYTASQQGGLCVLRAGKDWEVVDQLDLKETCMATPALAGGKVYVRTEKHLYAFGERQ